MNLSRTFVKSSPQHTLMMLCKMSTPHQEKQTVELCVRHPMGTKIMIGWTDRFDQKCWTYHVLM